jgi:hypothetical protein
VPQAGPPLDRRAPAPKPGGTTSKQPVGPELDPAPESKTPHTVDKTTPIVGRKLGLASGQPLAGSQQQRTPCGPTGSHHNCTSSLPALRDTQEPTASVNSPQPLNDPARPCRADRAATQSAPHPLRRPGEPQSRPDGGPGARPDEPGARERSSKSKQKSRAGSSRLSQLRSRSTSIVDSRHSCIHGRAGISTSATRPLVCAWKARTGAPNAPRRSRRARC